MMLGFGATGELALSTLPGASARLEGRAFLYPLYQPASATLAGSALARINSDNRIFAATEDFTSRPGDMVSSRLFAGTVRQALRFSRSILGGDAFDSYTLGLGEMILTNASGEYDHLIGTHAVDGRPVRVRLGGAGDPYDSFGVIFDGQSTGWHVSEDELIISLRDFGHRLEVPVSANTYAGTGGIEGGEDLKGQRKPRAFGVPRNVRPAVLTLNTTLLHQVNDGPVVDIPAVYVRGVPLGRRADYPTVNALLAASIDQGTYATCLSAGIFRLRFLGDDDGGQVTADVVAHADASTVSIVAGLAQSVGIERRNARSFAAVSARQSAPIGFYLAAGDEMDVASLAARLMAGIGGWVGFRRNGELEVGIVDVPVGAVRARFTDIEINDIDRETLPAALEVPARRIRVGWGVNWTVQDTELAGSVSAERRAFLREGRRVAEANDDRITRNHPLARDPEIAEAFFARETDAQAEAARRLRLYRTPRSLYRLTLKTQPFALDLGDEVHVTYPRWDLKGGRSLRLVSLDEDTENDLVEVVLFG